MENAINKKALAAQIFVEMNGHDKAQCSRKSLIERFVNECGMTNNYASLAVHSFRHGLWKLNHEQPTSEVVVAEVVAEVQEAIGEVASEQEEPQVEEEQPKRQRRQKKTGSE